MGRRAYEQTLIWERALFDRRLSNDGLEASQASQSNNPLQMLTNDCGGGGFPGRQGHAASPARAGLVVIA